MTLRPYALALFFTIAATSISYAADCSIRGTVTTGKDEPAPGVRLLAMKTGMFKSTVRQVLSGPDGGFSIADVPCGKYTIIAGDVTATVDTARTSTMVLTIDRRMAQAARAAGDMLAPATAAASVRRPLNPEENQDEDIADRFRHRTVERLGTEQEVAAYRAASAGDERQGRFRSIVLRQLTQTGLFSAESGGADVCREPSTGARSLNPFARAQPRPNPAPASGLSANCRRDADKRALRFLAVAKTLVAGPLPAPDQARFDSASHRDQARMTLVAALKAVENRPWPSVALLALVDADRSGGLKSSVMRTFGADSPEFRDWDAHLSPRWRGDVVHRMVTATLDAAIAVLDGQLSVEAFAERAELQADWNTSDLMSLRTVANTFGAKGLQEYESHTTEERAQMLLSAMLMQMAVPWGYLAML